MLDSPVRRMLAFTAQRVLGVALAFRGIMAGPHSIEVTQAGNLKLELTPHESQQLADIITEASR